MLARFALLLSHFVRTSFPSRRSAILAFLLLDVTREPRLARAPTSRIMSPPDQCWVTTTTYSFGDDSTRKALRKLVQTHPKCRVVGLAVRIVQKAVFALGYDRNAGIILRAVRFSDSEHHTWEAWKSVTDNLIIGHQGKTDDMHLGPPVDTPEAAQMGAGPLGRLVLSHLPPSAQ